MTVTDGEKIDRLRAAVEEYHVTVEKHITRCAGCRRTVREHHRALWRKGGLRDTVQSLKQSRTVARRGAAALWLAVVTLMGKWLFRG